MAFFGQETTRETVADLEKIRAVVDAHASEELRKSLADEFGTTPPLPSTAQFVPYQIRVTRALAEIVEGLATAHAANAPRKRGRPPKTAEATSPDAGMDRPGEEAVATD